MKRVLSVVLVVLFMCVGAWCTTVVTNTKIIGIDGQPFNGTLTLQLPFAGVNSQTNQLILSTPYTITIFNGSFTPFVVPGNDIMSPAMPYSALYADSSGNPITRQLYYISSTTFDVGSAPATPNFLNSTVTFANILSITGNATIGGTLAVTGGITSAPFKGPSPWFDVTTFGVKCDALTDNTVAFQSAWNAAKAVGSSAFVYVPPAALDCLVSGTLNFSSTNGVRFGGLGGGTATLSFPRIVFTGSTGPQVNCQNSLGLTFQNMAFTYNNAAFVGNVFDCTSVGIGNNIFWDNVMIGGTSTAKTAANLILAPGCQKCGARNSHFGWSINGINALGGNVFTIEDSDFGSAAGTLSGTYLVNTTAGSHIIGNNFEFINAPNTSSIFDSSSAGCFGCEFSGNWSGDMPAGWTGTVLKGITGGMSIHGNTFQGAATGTLLTINGGQNGLDFTGNSIQGPWGTIFTANASVSNVNITGNQYSGAITNFWTGAGNIPSSGIVTDNTGTTTIYSQGAQPTISAPSFPGIQFNAQGGAVDTKVWDILGTSTQLIFRHLNDALNSASNAFVVDNVGNVVSDVAIQVPFDLQEQGLPAGRASFSRLWADSGGDHMFKFNPNNSGEQHVPQVYPLTAQYTNSTTGFTTVGTPNIAFPVIANKNYTATCHLYYQAAATGGLNIQFTGPAAPTAVIYGLNEPVSTTAFAGDSVATAFSTSLGSVVTTATTNFDAIVSLSLINGANAGTVTLQAKSSAAVQLQIQVGSFCRVQ